MTARVLKHVSKERSVLEVTELPGSSDGIQIQSIYSFISKGTESIVARGLVPKEAYDNMQVPFMTGSFGFPLSYGYSLVGKVLQKEHELEGKIVQLMHPHQSFIEVPTDSLRLVPESISPVNATLVSNMETAINAVWNSNVERKMKVLIYGFGNIGALTSIALSNMVNPIISVYDTDKTRMSIANNMGFQSWDGSSDQDIVFHSTGNPEALNRSIEVLNDYGTVVEMSWYGSLPVPVKLGSSFHYGNKKIISSQVSSIPPHLKGWDFDKRLELAWQLLDDKRTDQLELRLIPFESGPDLFDQLRNGDVSDSGLVFSYISK